MATLLLTFVILLTVMVIMAIGVVMHGRPIKGSCGGMSSLGMSTACDICGGDTRDCKKEKGPEGKTGTGYYEI